MNPPLIGLATLARKAFHEEPLAPVSQALLTRLATDENDANALLDLATVLYLSGQPDLAQSMQHEALSTQRVFRLPNTLGLPEAETLRVLVFMMPGDLTRNTAIEFLTEGTATTLDLVYIEPGQPLPAPLPDHDIAFVAICESVANQAALLALAEHLKGWPRPLINPPAFIAGMSRDQVSHALQGLPGIHMPLFIRIKRAELVRIAQASADLETDIWPLIVRPLDSHKGQGLARIAAPAELGAYLADHHEPDFFIAPFVDYRSTDGQFRKYRVVLIDGEPWICHMSLSDHWMQHYQSAGMTEASPAGDRKRAAEAACFAGFRGPDGFATRHAEAFRQLHAQIDLPYIGLDCSETPNGELLIFEVDCGMTVHNMDPEALFPYKGPQMRAIFAAFHRMLSRHSGLDG